MCVPCLSAQPPKCDPRHCPALPCAFPAFPPNHPCDPFRSAQPPPCDPRHYPAPPCACPACPPNHPCDPFHSTHPPVRALPFHPTTRAIPSAPPIRPSAIPSTTLPCRVRFTFPGSAICLLYLWASAGASPLHISLTFEWAYPFCVFVPFVAFSPLASCLLPLASYLSRLTFHLFPSYALGNGTACNTRGHLPRARCPGSHSASGGRADGLCYHTGRIGS